MFPVCSVRELFLDWALFIWILLGLTEDYRFDAWEKVDNRVSGVERRTQSDLVGREPLSSTFRRRGSTQICKLEPLVRRLKRGKKLKENQRNERGGRIGAEMNRTDRTDVGFIDPSWWRIDGEIWVEGSPAHQPWLSRPHPVPPRKLVLDTLDAETKGN